jgi:hypothetical protein
LHHCIEQLIGDIAEVEAIRLRRVALVQTPLALVGGDIEDVQQVVGAFDRWPAERGTTTSPPSRTT